MSFVVEIPSIFTKPTQIPNRLGNTILSGNETILGDLLVNGSFTLNEGNNNDIVYQSLDILTTLTVRGESQLNNVNVSGIMTLNNQPRFMAYYRNNVDASFAVTGNVPYNTIKYDIGGGYNTSNYTYTIPETGLYLFTLSYISNNVAQTIVDIQNGPNTIQRSEDFLASTSLGETIHMCIYHQCNKNDVIRAIIMAGSIRVVYDSNASEQGYQQFTGFKVA